MSHFYICPILALQTVIFFIVFASYADDTKAVSIDSAVSHAIKQDNPSALIISSPSYSDSSDTTALLKTRTMFARLGDFHKSRGIFGIVTGLVGIFAGVVFLDKNDSTPLALSCFALGGISIGFGIWEMKIGRSLLRFEKPDK
jgi:hypothetical protein